MSVTVGDVMRYCRNYFERNWADREFTISGGMIDGFATPMYIAIQGSLYNDGVHRVSDAELVDETFNGRVWGLAPPRDFLALCEKINAFEEHNQPSSYTSESFGNYSYSRAVDAGGGAVTWHGAFAAYLRPYMRIVSEVMA